MIASFSRQRNIFETTRCDGSKIAITHSVQNLVRQQNPLMIIGRKYSKILSRVKQGSAIVALPCLIYYILRGGRTINDNPAPMMAVMMTVVQKPIMRVENMYIMYHRKAQL